jgi:hypothetical protein
MIFAENQQNSQVSHFSGEALMRLAGMLCLTLGLLLLMVYLTFPRARGEVVVGQSTVPYVYFIDRVLSYHDDDKQVDLCPTKDGFRRCIWKVMGRSGYYIPTGLPSDKDKEILEALVAQGILRGY